MNSYASYSGSALVSPIKQNTYSDHIFCCIENGEDGQVIEFFQLYPQIAKRLITQNNWTPAMYAARYGRIELLRFFFKEQLVSNGNPYTIVHAACFGNEYEILKYLLDQQDRHHTPMTFEKTPLKICMMINNTQFMELLISRGAYYIFNDFVFNLVEYQYDKDQIKYKPFNQEQKFTQEDIVNNSGEVAEIHILKFNQHPTYQPQKQMVRWFRIKNLALLDQLQIANPSNPSLLKQIIEKESYKNHLITYLLGPKKTKIDTE